MNLLGGGPSDPPFDDSVHGTHTTSMAAGNFIDHANIFRNANGTSTGMAPLAHIAMYKVCSEDGSYKEADMLDGIEAAIYDCVNVISISIGRHHLKLYDDYIIVCSFAAIRNGIIVVNSAGKKGPGSGGSFSTIAATWKASFTIKPTKQFICDLRYKNPSNSIGLALSQSHYIEKVLDKFKDIEFGIPKTPLDMNFALRKNEGESDSQLEYARVLGCLIEEVEWLRNFLKDIPYWPKPVAPVCIHCDRQAKIGKAGSMMYNGISCHIRWRHNTIRELLSSGIITIDYVKSKDNVSDQLTKGLSREGVERTSKGMRLRPRTSQHSGNLPSRLEITRARFKEIKQSFLWQDWTFRNHLCKGEVEAASKRILVKAYSLSSHETGMCSWLKRTKL
ncbi:hypothetical protein CQW23_00816 [Capsicum baccatum]|uniref:Peptidase S8/S53 domain-containing protein n=1 Tax=Capsicum baccatum TaxID=33114 RepID=A0A2G2XLS9_CAPBA|nr:hypothetical protein CQW23_00816 [Capsicum baccatum]